MACPKCESSNVCGAPDEAPAWAQQWTKCFACGKRWDQAGPAPRQTEDEEELDELEDPPPVKRTGAELVALVMNVAKATRKEGMMRAQCTKKGCEAESAIDSVKCPHHRDQQRAKNEAYGRLKRGLPPLAQTGTPTKRGRPAKKTAVALRPPEAVVVAPVNGFTLDGTLDQMLDQAIERCKEDVVVLERARAVLGRLL